jgi:hypothetical protein
LFFSLFSFLFFSFLFPYISGYTLFTYFHFFISSLFHFLMFVFYHFIYTIIFSFFIFILDHVTFVMCSISFTIEWFLFILIFSYTIIFHCNKK